MKLPWQHPPRLVEGCSSVSVGWLADMLADGPSRLLGRSRMGPPSTSLGTCPPGPVLVILSLFTRLHRALECPTWTIDLSWSKPLMEQVGKLRRKVSAPGMKGRQDLLTLGPESIVIPHQPGILDPLEDLLKPMDCLSEYIFRRFRPPKLVCVLYPAVPPKLLPPAETL